MSGQHTPGPWTVRTLENFGWNIVHYVGGDRCNLARVAKTSSEEDARLIAAAPDLLFALENLLAVKNGEGGTVFDSDEIARAAIAKARGDA